MSPVCTSLPSSTRSSERRPWIFDETTASRRATRYPEAVSTGVPAAAEPVCSITGETAVTSTLEKLPALRHASAPAPAAITITASRIQTPLRDFSGSSLRRSEARSAFRSLTKYRLRRKRQL